MDNKWTTVPNDDVIKKTVEELGKNNIEAFVVNDGEEAKKKFFELVPEGAEVMTNTSTTLDVLGISKEINESGKYDPVKAKLSKMDSTTQGIEKRRLGSAFQYGVGSIHAITQDGHVMMASGSGSQIPGYAYGADKVVWVAGAHKIVKDVNEGLTRIKEHSWPLEDKRMKDLGATGSTIRKVLIINMDKDPDRLKIIIVKEVLGF